LRDGVRTRDLGCNESTASFTEAVAREVSRRLAPEPSSEERLPEVEKETVIR
jgi:hypothetical protein